jgi:hypothetical protein
VVSKKCYIFVKKIIMMTHSDIKSVAPAVFATSPLSKLSNRYSFVPTFEIIENFEREGWNVSNATQRGKGIYSLHELRLRHNELPKVGDTLIEAIITNSHDGLSTLNIKTGLFRLVCSNGLTVPTSSSEEYKVRHSGFNIEDVKRVTEDFSKRLPSIQGSVNKMMERQLTIDEKLDFAKKASEIRWFAGKVPVSLNYEELLIPNRIDDNGDTLWQTFNVVQEKFIRGGVEYTTDKGRKSNLRTIKDIQASNRINTKLWELTETML